ncbi:MAG: hypothetical protein SOT80_07350 [Candidatus Pseudoruminococcus sp.]|nr:hypothetical protein [Candidatus Pseudoruminococcus sp.]
MRLLPDFVFDGTTFSLQYPYTIEGHLITKIEERIGFYLEENMIIFMTDNGMLYSFEKIRLLKSFQKRFLHYRRDYGNNYIDEDGLPRSIPFDNFNTWLQEIQSQCENLEWGQRFFIFRVLKKQNRAEKYDEENIYFLPERNLISNLSNWGTTSDASCEITTNTTSAVRQDSNLQEIINTVCSTFEGGDIVLSQDELRNIFPENTPGPNEFYISSAAGKSHKYIHPHNYKPEFIKHTNSPSSLLLGVEIEVAGNNHELNRNEVVKKCIQIMNASDSDEENLIYSTYDGTVQIELDTMPCSLEVHKTLNYKEMFKYLVNCGYRGHDCKNAGMHIHVDREYLGDTRFKQQLVISKIIYILEKFKDDICMIARKDSSYSQFIGKQGDTPFELYQLYKNFGKRAALNLQHDETIEFRCFRSTLKYETFILTLEFIQSIVDFAKAINIEGIESITWQDLMVKMPKSVQDYYANRKSKKEAQQKDLILKELKKQLKNLKSALSHALNDIEKIRLRKKIEKVNKQIKQRKADNKKGCSNSDEEFVAHP